MGDASPIGFVLGTKLTSLLEFDVLINFLLPAWATRGEEVDDPDLDKAAREFAERF